MLADMLPSRFWTQLSLRDMRAHDMSRVIAVLPIAAVEQHGPHLPLGVDAMIMEAASSASRRACRTISKPFFCPCNASAFQPSTATFPAR